MTDNTTETVNNEDAPLGQADLSDMTPEQIVTAYDNGELDDLLARNTPGDTELLERATQRAVITRAELRRLSELGRTDLAAAYTPDRINN